MKALVTGGAGFIGSHLVDTLVSYGHDVTVIDNESAESNEMFFWNPRAKNFKLDINDCEKTAELYQGKDVVFHLAAESRIQPCIENPLRAVKGNMMGTANVLECARQAGVKRVVYSSTSSAYGLANNPPMIETMPIDCLNPYSVTKVGGEELCKMYASLFGMETVIFRYFNVYGERQPIRGQYAPVIGIFLRQKLAKEPMTIVGDGEQRRDFTHVSDVVEANMLAGSLIKIGEKWGKIYNVGTGRNHSVNEVASLIGGETVNIPPRQGEARVTLADYSNIKNNMGWNPKVRLEDWIAKHK